MRDVTMETSGLQTAAPGCLHMSLVLCSFHSLLVMIAPGLMQAAIVILIARHQEWPIKGRRNTSRMSQQHMSIFGTL